MTLEPKELTKLAQELAGIGPGWTLMVGSELLSALRLGTRRYESVGATAEHLLAEVQATEARIEETSPLVHRGLDSTTSHAPMKAT